jgi:hypothetical protein
VTTSDVTEDEVLRFLEEEMLKASLTGDTGNPLKNLIHMSSKDGVPASNINCT